MRAVVFLGEGELQLTEFPDPTPGTAEAILESKASAMCGTDLHRYRGPRLDQLLIAGHEPCGVVWWRWTRQLLVSARRFAN
ncbi:MAG: threonine dehydrogenase-like Zn-dependent dehydrogenase [Gammaproteobacteria bacterium]|jgi:threonine dehydrogenase-like Zn-dependent dehydrogenase